MSKKHTRITLDHTHAHVPQALAPFLLAPDKPRPYRWWTRWADAWAGWRDRTEPGGAPTTQVADTPWLRRLAADCDNATASGRHRTESLVAVLDRRRAALMAAIEQCRDTIDAAAADVEEHSAAPITAEVVGAGELYSPPDEILRRRRHERDQRVGGAARQLARARAQLRELNQELEVVEQERQSHWVVLQERTRVLIEYYQRRAATYCRALEQRRDRQFWGVPDLRVPGWASSPLGSGGVADTAAPVLLQFSDYASERTQP